MREDEGANENEGASASRKMGHRGELLVGENWEDKAEH